MGKCRQKHKGFLKKTRKGLKMIKSTGKFWDIGKTQISETCGKKKEWLWDAEYCDKIIFINIDSYNIDFAREFCQGRRRAAL